MEKIQTRLKSFYGISRPGVVFKASASFVAVLSVIGRLPFSNSLRGFPFLQGYLNVGKIMFSGTVELAGEADGLFGGVIFDKEFALAFDLGIAPVEGEQVDVIVFILHHQH